MFKGKNQPPPDGLSPFQRAFRHMFYRAYGEDRKAFRQVQTRRLLVMFACAAAVVTMTAAAPLSMAMTFVAGAALAFGLFTTSRYVVSMYKAFANAFFDGRVGDTEFGDYAVEEQKLANSGRLDRYAGGDGDGRSAYKTAGGSGLFRLRI